MKHERMTQMSSRMPTTEPITMPAIAPPVNVLVPFPPSLPLSAVIVTVAVACRAKSDALVAVRTEVGVITGAIALGRSLRDRLASVRFRRVELTTTNSVQVPVAQHYLTNTRS